MKYGITNRGIAVFLISLGLLAGGTLAMFLPVHIDSYDRWGFQVACGNGVSGDLVQANTADEANARRDGSASDYAGDCTTAVALRRAWAIPTAVLGWVALSWLAVRAVISDRHRSEAPVNAAGR